MKIATKRKLRRAWHWLENIFIVAGLMFIGVLVFALGMGGV